MLGATAMNAKMIHEYKSNRRPAPSELNPGTESGVQVVWQNQGWHWIRSLVAPEARRSKCDLNLKPGVRKATLEMVKERLLIS